MRIPILIASMPHHPAVGLYKHDDNGEITEYTRLDMPLEEHVEEFLHVHPDVVEKGIMIVGRQVETGGMGIPDLLGIDRHGNVVVIEVKKGDAKVDVVSQILRYAVWARDVNSDELNEAYVRLAEKYGKDEERYGKIGRTPDGRPDLRTAMEERFGEAPQPLNPGQRLYVVGEGIEQMTDDVCTYLRQNGIKIRCVSVEFFSDGEDGGGEDVQKRIRAVHTDADAERQDGGAFNKWDYYMGHYDAGVRKAIEDVISYLEDELGCPGKISEKGATCTFHAGGTRFAIVYAYKTKDYGNFEFLSGLGHDFPDERVGRSTYAFGDAGRDVRIVPDSVERVKECARLAYDAAKGAEASP